MITIQDFESKQKKDEKILVLKVIDGTKPKTSMGMVDPRVFSGDNKIWAKQGPDLLWAISYDKGIMPPGLHQKFTTFSKLKAFAENYFKKRNLEIIEVIE